MHVSERDAWSARAGNGGMECMRREGRLGVHVQERDA